MTAHFERHPQAQELVDRRQSLREAAAAVAAAEDTTSSAVSSAAGAIGSAGSAGSASSVEAIGEKGLHVVDFKVRDRLAKSVRRLEDHIKLVRYPFCLASIELSFNSSLSRLCLSALLGCGAHGEYCLRHPV